LTSSALQLHSSTCLTTFCVDTQPGITNVAQPAKGVTGELGSTQLTVFFFYNSLS
jgi:hypothetical protein